MSITSSIDYYRPGPAPHMPAADLARFLECFAASGVLKESAICHVAKVKFGDAIDQDDEPSTWNEPTANECVFTSAEIEWDLEWRGAGLAEFAALLRERSGDIYRAHINLGQAKKAISDALIRESVEHGSSLGLWDWNLHIGPISRFSHESETEYEVGWIEVTLWGYGSMFPWKPRELIDCALAFPEVASVLDLCRETWPVQAEAPNEEWQSMRRDLGDYWPYPSVDIPIDWCWGATYSF